MKILLEQRYLEMIAHLVWYKNRVGVEVDLMSVKKV